MTYSQINPTKVRDFLLLTSFILVVGCNKPAETPYCGDDCGQGIGVSGNLNESNMSNVFQLLCGSGLTKYCVEEEVKPNLSHK